MAHNIETMAYANAKPWHGLGTEVSDTLTPAQFYRSVAKNTYLSKTKISSTSSLSLLKQVI
jgi:hypothetical protein